MKNWERLVEQEPGEKHEQQVLASMDSLLEQNARLAEGRAAPGSTWLYWLLPSAAGLAALALVLVLKKQAGSELKVPSLQAAAASPMLEIAMDYELLTDLQEIRYLDELQKLEGSKEWKSRKSATRKL